MTTDTGTPGPAHWEMNTAEISTTSKNSRLIQVPYFDLNYGVGKTLQLKLEGGYSNLKDQGMGTKNGTGPLEAGIKWRFYDQSGLSVSVYPQLQFRSIISSNDPLIAEQETYLDLPVEVMKQFGSYAINSEVAYVKSLTDQQEQMYYGLAASKEVHPGWELVGEVFGVTRIPKKDTQLLMNLGTRYTLNKHYSLNFSVGHTVENFDGETGQWFTYAGVQAQLWKRTKKKIVISP